MAEKDLYAEDSAGVEEKPADKPPSPASGDAAGGSASLVATFEERRTVTAPPRRGLSVRIGNPRVSDAVLTAFLRQLVMKLEAGVPLLRAITTLADRTPDPAFRDIIIDVGSRVEGGSTLWQAFDAHPKHFDRLFVNLVKAGETSGTLTGVLNRVAEHRQKRSLLRKQVRSAMIYPAVIFAVTMTVLLLFLTLVLPGFETIFTAFGIALPLPTKAALWVSHSLFTAWVFVYIGVIAGGIFAFLSYRATPAGRLSIDRHKMTAWVFGDIFTKAVIADFTRTFATLLGAGISILETLDLARDAVGNTAFAVDIQHMRDSIEAGEGLERPLRQSRLTPAIVTDMLVTGEESGALERISHQVADIYEAEVEIAVAQLKNMLEPVVILFLGVIVGFLCLSFFGPYVKLMNSVMEQGL